MAVSVDAAEGEQGQKAFAALLDLDFPFIPDTGRNLSILYGAARKPYSTAWRRTMLIDNNGILRFVDTQVNVFTHGPEMVSKIQELKMTE